MLYYLTAAGLIAHTYFWGLGPACLVLPRVWRRAWWVFAPGLGLALQSAVVWAGAHTAVPGTDAYARWSELLPLALIALAIWLGRAPAKSRGALGVLLVAVVAGWLLVSPMAQPGRGLTASSLGSCDHADYAAGARVFQEFSRDDHTGFLGLPEVTRVRSADYFFDFWLRLNHFTPSALLAHNATVFGTESYRLISVTAAVLVLLNLPVVLWLARVALGVRGRWLPGVVVLYAISPLNAYAVHQGALGQLYAAQGIACLTLAIFGAERAARRRQRLWPYFFLLLAAFWILAGSYNFILLVCLAPAGAWLFAQLTGPRDLRALVRFIGLVAAALGACGVMFWGRFDGLLERFSLFEQYNFGWVVPVFSPEGWLGILRDTGLHAWPQVVRISLSTAVVILWLAGLVALGRRGNRRAQAAAALVVPVILGWSILARETAVRANASYDAYKLLAVFYPGLLIGLLCWLPAAQRAGRRVQLAAAAALTLILTANFAVAGDFRRQMAAPPLRVDRTTAELIRLESDPQVTSLNMLVDDYWSRLWANAFLLRKAQYFTIHTYEGRLNTALKGEWNLSDSLLRVVPLHVTDYLPFNERFHLVRAGAPGLMAARFAAGWHGEEHLGANRWRWSNGNGQISLENPTGQTVRAALRLRGRGLTPALLTVQVGSQTIATPWLDGSLQDLTVEGLVLPPGRSQLVLASAAAAAGAGDDRALGFALYGLELRVLAVEK